MHVRAAAMAPHRSIAASARIARGQRKGRKKAARYSAALGKSDARKSHGDPHSTHSSSPLFTGWPDIAAEEEQQQGRLSSVQNVARFQDDRAAPCCCSSSAAMSGHPVNRDCCCACCGDRRCSFWRSDITESCAIRAAFSCPCAGAGDPGRAAIERCGAIAAALTCIVLALPLNQHGAKHLSACLGTAASIWEACCSSLPSWTMRECYNPRRMAARGGSWTDIYRSAKIQ